MYPLEPQELGKWCWAAVALSIEKFWEPASTLRQCDVATLVKGPDCCANANKKACNKAAELHVALQKVEHFHDMLYRRMTFSEIQTSVAAGFPVCVRIGWWSGGGHYVVITGASPEGSAEEWVTIADPLYESGDWQYDEFADFYFGIGQWTHTYRVRR